MNNPFDDPAGIFHVLINEEGQYSLWPDFAKIPSGWSVVLASVDRESAIAHVEEHWSDLRPRHLLGTPAVP